jgi:hypothetical protein
MSQDDTSQDRDDIREIFTDLDMGILTESEAAELLLASRSKLEALLDKADELRKREREEGHLPQSHRSAQDRQS